MPIYTGAMRYTAAMRSLALTIAVVVIAVTNAGAAQPAGFLQRLVGVWRLTGVDHPEHEDHLYTLELEFTSRSEYRLYYRVDLENPIVCEGTLKVDADSRIFIDTDPANECDVFNADWNGHFYPDESLLYDGDFRAVLTGRSLELHKSYPSSGDDDQVLRFERGRVPRVAVPSTRPCAYSIKEDPVDGDGTLPPLARRNGPAFFPFDWTFEAGWTADLKPSALMGVEGVRRRWLQRAVDALEGRAAPVLLKFSFPTRHGALVEQFLDVRKGSADLTIWEAPGAYQKGELTQCQISEMVAVEPLEDNRLIPMRPGGSAARARLLLRLDPEDWQVAALIP